MMVPRGVHSCNRRVVIEDMIETMVIDRPSQRHEKSHLALCGSCGLSRDGRPPAAAEKKTCHFVIFRYWPKSTAGSEFGNRRGSIRLPVHETLGIGDHASADDTEVG